MILLSASSFFNFRFADLLWADLHAGVMYVWAVAAHQGGCLTRDSRLNSNRAGEQRSLNTRREKQGTSHHLSGQGSH